MIISHSPFSTCLFSKRTGRLRLDRRGDAAYIGRNEDSLVFPSHPLPFAFASLSFLCAQHSSRAGKRILLLVVGGSNLFFETARPIHSPPPGTSLLFPSNDFPATNLSYSRLRRDSGVASQQCRRHFLLFQASPFEQLFPREQVFPVRPPRHRRRPCELQEIRFTIKISFNDVFVQSVQRILNRLSTTRSK